MNVVWLLILGFILVGYFVLEGFVLGAGVLLGRYGTREDNDVSVAAFAPFVLANEVWLVAVAGVLMGAFPVVEGEIISGLYPFVVAGLIGWVVRDAGLWFRLRDSSPAWRRLWARAITAGSGLLIVAWGFALGNLLLGMPTFPLSAGALFDPYAVIWGVTLPALIVVHGAVFLTRRLPERLSVEVRRLGVRAVGIALVLVGAATAIGVVAGYASRGWAGVLGMFPLFGAVAAMWLIRQRPFDGSTGLFVLSAAAVCAPVLAVGLGTAPELVSHAAGGRTLTVLALYGIAALVFVVAVQVWAWRKFDRRVKEGSVSFF
ncbi:cytochrome d ubiquinol oxidase subunit II [Sinosporangium siamense]|uniref:Cytochrome bd oxidase subunit II n=1 Tax=Sinosporangium siamense TaxID=1367973 RepID=A0A919RJN6_9ACTN|nr:cytochrome d ubiquinol oxidase subunit II [Sinosporangium siamense]GII95062.1 cytochrome bd oxidase subunit II [Sinosporangium siamense]